MNKYNLVDVLEVLVDEVKDSENPSELTIDILASFEEKYDFIKEYFKELDEKDNQ